MIVVARAFYDIMSSGPSERKEVHETVRMRMTGRKFVPKFERRTHLKAFVLDSSAKEIAEDILNNLSEESEPRGMILIREVSDAYEIGTKKSGDAILTTQ